jgi:Domain of unknown function (DUF1611_C) P-loop domain
MLFSYFEHWWDVPIMTDQQSFERNVNALFPSEQSKQSAIDSCESFSIQPRILEGTIEKGLRATSSIYDIVQDIKWSWACRVLGDGKYRIITSPPSNSVNDDSIPVPGDVVVVKIDQIGNHSSVVTIDNKKLRLYVGDFIVGVFGNRYATDAYEAEVIGTENLSLLTAGGMIGTVRSKHRNEVKSATKVSFIGYLVDGEGQRVNLKRLNFNVSNLWQATVIENLIVVVGTGMNTGKTTAVRMLIRGLSEKGLKVAACKLTGSVSNRDQDEMKSALAKCTMDFSDYGFPSTYLASKQELIDLFNVMLTDAAKSDPDLVVMEIADGILQRETYMLLTDDSIRRKVGGIVLAAESALSALYAVEFLKNLGYNIMAVSGVITSAPLYVKEFQQHSGIGVASSIGSGRAIVDRITSFINKDK